MRSEAVGPCGGVEESTKPAWFVSVWLLLNQLNQRLAAQCAKWGPALPVTPYENGFGHLLPFSQFPLLYLQVKSFRASPGSASRCKTSQVHLLPLEGVSFVSSGCRNPTCDGFGVSGRRERGTREGWCVPWHRSAPSPDSCVLQPSGLLITALGSVDFSHPAQPGKHNDVFFRGVEEVRSAP